MSDQSEPQVEAVSAPESDSAASAAEPDAAEPAAEPGRGQGCRRALAVLGIVVLVLVLTLVGIVAFLNWTLKAAGSPKPATVSAMNEMEAQAAEQFPAATIDYKHRYNRQNSIEVEARIPVRFPVDDAEIERIAELFESQHARSSGRWGYQLDLRLVDGDREVSTTTGGPTGSLADGLRLANLLVEEGFDSIGVGTGNGVGVGVGDEWARLDVDCPPDSRECRQEAGERMLAALDRAAGFGAARPHVVWFNTCPPQVSERNGETRETSIAVRLPENPDAGWRQRVQDALAVWVEVEPVTVVGDDGGTFSVGFTEIEVSGDSSVVSLRIGRSDDNRYGDLAGAAVELQARVREHGGETVFSYRRG